MRAQIIFPTKQTTNPTSASPNPTKIGKKRKTHALEINIQRKLSQIVSMEIKLVVFEVFNDFDDVHVPFKRESVVIIEFMSVGGFVEV
jgi:hypothetical protein